jgi:hypothetical protein
MRNLILSFLLTCSLFTAKAQLLNPSFENTDSLGNIDGWSLTQGKMSKHSVLTFGAVPFTAAQGNYFISLRSDTLVVPAERALFEQHCAFTDTPGSIYMNYLFIPENTDQRAQIELLLTKWNGGQRDTVLFISDTIAVVANGNNILIQWNTWSETLTGQYRMAILPDSAHVTLSNSDNTLPGKNLTLFADNITLSRWAVGLNETQMLQATLFPNPTSDLLTIRTDGIQEIAQFMLTDITGKQFAVAHDSFGNGEYTIRVNAIPDGLYTLTMLGTHYPLHKQVLIKH